MKELFVLSGGWLYEGSEVVGVYSTQEKAEAAKLGVPKTRYDFLCIHAYVLDFEEAA